MSIKEEIDRRISEKALKIHELLLPSAEQPRVVLVESGFHEELMSASKAADEEGFRIGELLRDFDRFSNGSLITVGYGKEQTCFLKHLDPPDEEVWELRSRDPTPSWRVFCRFAMPDVLVALNAAPRSHLGRRGSKHWKEAIRDCKTRWRRLFQVDRPFGGEHARDYITERVLVVSEMP